MNRIIVAAFLAATLANVAFAQDRTWAEWTASKSATDEHTVSRVNSLDWWKACSEWGRLYRSNSDAHMEDALFALLRSKSMLTDADWGNAGGNTVEVGMTQCGVFAAIGMPDGGANTQDSAARSSTQLIYRRRHMYIYTDDTHPTAGMQTVTTIQRGP